MSAKLHTHRVTISKRRRENKRSSDMAKKSVSKRDLQDVFDQYYRNQVRALYNAVQSK